MGFLGVPCGLRVLPHVLAVWLWCHLSTHRRRSGVCLKTNVTCDDERE